MGIKLTEINWTDWHRQAWLPSFSEPDENSLSSFWTEKYLLKLPNWRLVVIFLLLMMGGGRLCDIVIAIVHSGWRRMTGKAEVTWRRRRIILGVSPQPGHWLLQISQLTNQILQGRTILTAPQLGRLCSANRRMFILWPHCYSQSSHLQCVPSNSQATQCNDVSVCLQFSPSTPLPPLVI